MAMNDFLECLREIIDYISRKIFHESIQYLRDFLEEIKKADCGILYKDIKEMSKLRYYLVIYFETIVSLSITFILEYMLYYLFSLINSQIYFISWIIIIIFAAIMLFIMIGIACYISVKFSIKALRRVILIYFLNLTIFLWIELLSVIIHKIIIFNYKSIILETFIEEIFEEILFSILLFVFYIAMKNTFRIKCSNKFEKLKEEPKSNKRHNQYAKNTIKKYLDKINEYLGKIVLIIGVT